MMLGRRVVMEHSELMHAVVKRPVRRFQDQPHPLTERIRIDTVIEIAPGRHFDAVDITADDRGGLFQTWIGEMRQDHDASLFPALPGPFGQQHFDGIADGRLIRTARGHRGNDASVVTQKRNVTENMLPVLGADSDQMFSIPARFFGAPCRAGFATNGPDHPN